MRARQTSADSHLTPAPSAAKEKALNWVRDNLLIWRKPCLICQHRKPDFQDGVCFDCTIDRQRGRILDDIVDAMTEALRPK
jgi:hypothetical protein